MESVARTYFPLLRGGAEAQRLATREPTLVFEQFALASGAGFVVTLARKAGRCARCGAPVSWCL